MLRDTRVFPQPHTRMHTSQTAAALRARAIDRPAIAQIWNTYTGEDMHTLEGHKNVVSTVHACARRRSAADAHSAMRGFQGAPAGRHDS